MNNINVEFEPSVSKEVAAFTRKVFKEQALEKLGVEVEIKPFSFIVKENKKMIAVLEGLEFYGSLMVTGLAVLKEHRSKGIGTLLMNKAIDYAKEKGFKFISLATFDFQALDFYKKFGFVVQFTSKGFMLGTEVYHLRKDI